MTAIATEKVLQELQAGYQTASNRVAALHTYPAELLTAPPAGGGWSIAQIIEHLNFYNRFYCAQLEAAVPVARRRGSGPAALYQAGWLGNYFVRVMRPRPDGSVPSKMKAPAVSTPAAGLEPATVLADFDMLQQRLAACLRDASGIRLDQVRVRTMLPLVSLRVGDALRFVLAHQERHLAQVDRTWAAVRKG